MLGARPALLVSFTCWLLQLWSCSAASGEPLCREAERSALLGFKSSFFNESNCSYYAYSSPSKMMSWTAEEGKAGDCCNWGGVTCDKGDGHVIGLDLSTSCLAGRIDSKASIFGLVHLQELNLAYNSLSRSRIPASMGNLTSLTRLNLSFSGFGGKVLPKMMMSLSNPSSLDLSENTALIISGLEELLQNLSKIEELHLGRVKVSDGKVPRSLGNMTSLRSLVLSECGLSGEFPDSVFALPGLEFLDVSQNHALTGRLTGLHRGSPVRSLNLFETNFTGELPVSLGYLRYLTEINLGVCGFWGEIPSSIGDLSKLEFLSLGGNKFHGPIPPSIGNLTSLTGLSLHRNRLSGGIPSSVGNLIQLDWLYLGSNQLTGEIPSSLTQLPLLAVLDLSSNMLTGNVPSRIGNLTRLTHLDLSRNKFYGPLPNSTNPLRSLYFLNLATNYLTGVARLDQLKGVLYIYLSSNAFSSVIFPETDVSVSQIELLGLDSGNLTEVPQFLKHPHKLEQMSLSKNDISEETTIWLALDLSHNHIQGTLPIPPNSIGYYLISNNRLSGEIPLSICKLENVIMLNLADNNFTGVLPPCLGNLSSTLGALSLSGNNFGGKIPELNHENCGLDTIDLSSNLFEGPLPRSLSNCRMLEYVNLGRNKITDTFPSWLGSLPSLKVLMLHSNGFHGLMTAPRNNSSFPSLKVIHLSTNNLRGPLPANLFARWQAMKYPSPDDDEYPDPYVRMAALAIIDKGIKREFGKTLGYFTLVDLSSNNFSGTIPVSVGDNLLKLHTLNLSNNDLSGQIPLSLANLQNLEVLDLSRNRLSGEIPGVLSQITSLVIFNVSYNNLSGAIPRGNQFGTFENTSYIGNQELCGAPLTKRCGNSMQFPLTPARNSDEKTNLQFGIVWITALVGLAGGLVVGVALEQAFGDDVMCWLERKWRKYWTSYRLKTAEEDSGNESIGPLSFGIVKCVRCLK